MKKALLIYNPLSGDHSVSNKLDYVIGRFQDTDILLQPYRFFNFSEKSLLKVLLQPKLDFIIVSGGDGTLNYVTNLMLKNKLNLPIGIIPSGTCNDFAGSLSIPQSLTECLDIILAGKTLEVDAGLINDKTYFLSTCAGGLFVDVSFNTHHELKKNFGPLAYYLNAINEVANVKPFRIKIKTESNVIEEEALIFLILNGARGAGFSNLISEANISDGMMDIMLIKNCNHIDMAALFFKVLSNDFHSDKHITKLRAKFCSVESSTNITLSVDGEKGMNLPINVQFINKALKVFVI